MQVLKLIILLWTSQDCLHLDNNFKIIQPQFQTSSMIQFSKGILGPIPNSCCSSDKFSSKHRSKMLITVITKLSNIKTTKTLSAQELFWPKTKKIKIILLMTCSQNKSRFIKVVLSQ